jgi:hypothetical protein
MNLMPPPPPPHLSWLDVDYVWRTLVSRLNGEADHDLLVIAGFAEAFEIEPRAVVAKMRTHILPASRAIN